MYLFYLEHLSVSVIHFMSYCDTAPFPPLASCPCPCSSNVPFPRMGSPSSAWLMPPGFQSFPISKSVTIFQDLTGDFLFLYGTRTLLMQFFRVTKAVSAQSPLQCQNSPQVSLCPLSSSSPSKFQPQGAAAIWFPCAFPYHALASNSLQRERSK